MVTLDKESVVHLTTWFLNVSSSVLIVVVNKYLMSTVLGYGFVYATTLCALHFGFCALASRALETAGVTTPAGALPLSENLAYALVSSTAISCANLSLLLNSIGFYQIVKLLIAPVVCAFEFLLLGMVFSFPSLVSMVLVVSGVTIVTVTDVTTQPLGLLVALIFVLFSALQQIYCGFLQRKHGMGSTQLLSATAPTNFVLVGLLGPPIDWLMKKSWVTDYEFSTGSISMITLSCAVAVLVNISQFMCLGRFSATTYSVMGHAKTVLVLIGGVVLFNERMSMEELMGMGLAVLGMVAYSYFASKYPATARQETKSGELQQPLLQQKDSDPA